MDELKPEGTTEEEKEDKELCSIAIEESLRMCKGSEEMFRLAAVFMGFSDQEFKMVMPLAENYTALILDGETNGLDEITVRTWVLAKAYEYVKVHGKDAIQAFQAAWTDARKMKERVVEEPAP